VRTGLGVRESFLSLSLLRRVSLVRVRELSSASRGWHGLLFVLLLLFLLQFLLLFAPIGPPSLPCWVS